jgi:hypothetical protein
MRTCKFLALAAIAAFNTVATGQDLVHVPRINAYHAVSPVGFPARPSGYDQRDIQPVYDTLGGGFFYLGNCAHSIDDVGFANGPWEGGNEPQLITQLTYSVYIQGADVIDEQNLVILWRKSDVNLQGFNGAETNMIRPGATPLAVIRVNVPSGPPTFATAISVDLTGLPAGGVLIPTGDDGLFIDVAWITQGYTPSPTANSGDQPDWSNLASNASGSLWGGRDPATLIPYNACPFATSDRSVLFSNKSNAPNGGNPAFPGVSRREYGRDIARNDNNFSAMCDHIGQFMGNDGPAAPSGPVEHRYIAADSDSYAFSCRILGVVGSPPPCMSPAVTSQPVARTTCAGSSVSFTVTFSGTSTSLQWRKNGADIPGATSGTLTLAAPSVTDAGVYDCVATNACGNATSDAAMLTVTPLLTIERQPVDQYVGVDAPVSFAVQVEAIPGCETPVTYQWQRRNPAVIEPEAANAWIDLQESPQFLNVRSAGLIITGPVPALATGYRCRIGGGCGCRPASGVIHSNTVNFGIACPADFNADGGIDGQDIFDFFERWENGC